MQIFLEGKLLGVNDCLLAPATRDADQVFTGRSHWISLLSEVLPRALLAELGLAKILLGSSGGGRFLLVLPEESRPGTEAFLTAMEQSKGKFVLPGLSEEDRKGMADVPPCTCCGPCCRCFSRSLSV